MQPVISIHVFLDTTACFPSAKEYHNILIFHLNKNVYGILIFFQWAVWGTTNPLPNKTKQNKTKNPKLLRMQFSKNIHSLKNVDVNTHTWSSMFSSCEVGKHDR